jgi:polyferredoxin
MIKFKVIRRRNQTVSFLVFLFLTVIMFATLIANPWYKIPVEWYFIPVLGLVGSFVLPAFSGRHYCGQYCPTGFLADSMPLKNKAGNFIKSKVFQWLMVFLLIGIFAVSFSPWKMGLSESMTATYWDAVLNKLWILWLICPFAIALPTVVLLGLSKGGRTWCNYMCPWGAIATRFGKSQLHINDNCTNCRSCIDSCSQPEILEPVIGKGGEIDKSCLVCLSCVDACEEDAINMNK